MKTNVPLLGTEGKGREQLVLGRRDPADGQAAFRSLRPCLGWLYP